MARQKKPNYPAGLPENCYTISPYSHKTVLIVRGETTFFGVHGRECADTLNRCLKVTKQQESAMCGGVQHGWDSPQADPKNYNACGRYIGPADK